ncbi:MAG: sulfite exporter TauE/SafE family protein [Proteobacteria bacterium]|nr:sulfite exporter TauE/SafE family protein [Pseudomonadota bacterium]
MSVELIAIVALGAVVAGFVQGLSGFAFGMVSMSFWAWSVEPRLAAMLAVFGALVGQVIAAVTVRRPFDRAVLWPFLAGGLLGVPVGIWLLPHFDLPLFQLCLGLLLALWCPLMIFSDKLPAIRWGGRGADGVIGAIGGVMGGIGGFAGVVPTLWCALRQMPRDEQRAIIQNFNLSMQIVAFTLHVAAGNVQWEMVPLLALVGVAVLVPVLLGGKLYLGISEQAFRKIVLGLLTASGVALLAASAPVLLKRLG